MSEDHSSKHLRQVAPIGVFSWKMFLAKVWIILGLILGAFFGNAPMLDLVRAWQAPEVFHTTFAIAAGSVIGTFIFWLPIYLYLRFKTSKNHE